MPIHTHTHTLSPPETRQNCFHSGLTPGLMEVCWRVSWLCIISVWLPPLQDQHIIKQLQAVLPVQQLPHLRKNDEKMLHTVNASAHWQKVWASASALLSLLHFNGCIGLHHMTKRRIECRPFQWQIRSWCLKSHKSLISKIFRWCFKFFTPYKNNLFIIIFLCSSKPLILYIFYKL